MWQSSLSSPIFTRREKALNAHDQKQSQYNTLIKSHEIITHTTNLTGKHETNKEETENLCNFVYTTKILIQQQYKLGLIKNYKHYYEKRKQWHTIMKLYKFTYEN